MEVRDTRFHEDAKELIDVLHRTLHGTGFIPKEVNLKRLVPALLVGAALIVGVLWLRFSGTEPYNRILQQQANKLHRVLDPNRCALQTSQAERVAPRNPPQTSRANGRRP